MVKKYAIFILLILVVIISISGCTTRNATNGTFGERTISLDAIEILNSTSEHYEYNGTNYFYIEGYLQNNNKYDAFNIKMKVIAYDKDGNIVVTNDSVYLEPKNIQGGGQTYFSFEFIDQDQIIERYEIQLIDAKAEPN